MLSFDVHDAAALLGYITLLVGFTVLGSAGLAFLQSLPSRLRNRNEPIKHRIRRIDPTHVRWAMDSDGHLTDIVEVDDEGHVVAEFHEHPPMPPGPLAEAWLPEDDDDDVRPVCD